MKRTIVKDLIGWKNRTSHKPLILQGVRQCGKTYVLKEFGREHFARTLYFNFEQRPALADIFRYDYDCQRILRELAVTAGIDKIVEDETLVIFDEIQECPEALNSLKYFSEECPAMYIAAAGSLLGPAIAHRQVSFPVGKVEFLQMYPMSFLEFIMASGMDDEVRMLQSYDLTRPLPDLVADRLATACRVYYAVGGMPEAVKTWVDTRDFGAVDKVLSDILLSYGNDFGKYLSPSDALKCTWIWDAIPVQLAKENNKFVFSHVKEGKRASELENALEWLRKAGLVYELNMVKTPQLPLSFYADATYFKLYMCDVGLLRMKSGLAADTVVNRTPLYDTFKGAFTENFVMGELLKYGLKPYFWRSENSAEVDFVFESRERVVPLESKSEGNTKAKSYKIFCSRYNPPLGFKVSMNNVVDNMVGDTLTYSLPLYMLWRLTDYLK